MSTLNPSNLRHVTYDGQWYRCNYDGCLMMYRTLEEMFDHLSIEPMPCSTLRILETPQ